MKEETEVPKKIDEAWKGTVYYKVMKEREEMSKSQPDKESERKEVPLVHVVYEND